MMQPGHDPRSERILPERASRRSNPPQRGRPAVVPAPEYPQARQPDFLAGTFLQDNVLPPYFPLLLNSRLPPLKLLIMMWTTFVSTPHIQESYIQCALWIFYQTRQIRLPLSNEAMSEFRHNLIQNVLRSFELTYLQFVAAGYVEEPLPLAQLFTYLQVTHITQQQYLSFPGWQQYFTQYIQMTTMAATAPPPPPSSPQPPSRTPSPPLPHPSTLPPPPPRAPLSPPPLRSLPTPLRPSPPAPMPPPPPPPQAQSEPPPPPLLPPLPQSQYSLPPLSPISSPTTSERGATTPEGPLDLSTMAFRDYVNLAPDILTTNRPLVRHRPQWTRTQGTYDESPANELVAQRSSSERTLSPPINSLANSPFDCFVAPEHFINQPPVNSQQRKSSGSSANSRPVRSSESATTFGPMTSQTSTPDYQPMTPRLSEHRISRPWDSGGHLVDSSETRKRGRSNESADVGTLEPPRKRTDDLSLRRSVISFEPAPVRSLEPRTVIANVPNPIYFPESSSVSGNEASTSRSFMTSATSTIPSHREIENEAFPMQLSESHVANVQDATVTRSYERSSLRSFNLPVRGSNEPPPTHTPVTTSGQMIWPFVTHSSMSPLAHSPMPTLQQMPPPPPPRPQTPKPPPTPKPPRTRIPPSTIVRPPTTTAPQKVLPIQPLAQYPAYSSMYMPPHPTMHMPRLPLDYMPLPVPENVPLPHQHRETTSCSLCGLNTHSANNCFLNTEHLRKQSRKK